MKYEINQSTRLSFATFQSLINSHDQAGDVIYEKLRNLESNHKLDKLIDISDDESSETMPEPIRMVGINRVANEPLGLTVEEDEFNQLKVARIITGGLIERQGLLSPGDVILEVNGVKVMSPEELQDEIARAKSNITLKIGANADSEIRSARMTAQSGSQVKEKIQESGKKLAVSERFVFFYQMLTRRDFFVLVLSFDLDLIFSFFLCLAQSNFLCFSLL